MRARLKARARSQKSASISFVRRGSKRTVMKKYRSERNGRRNFDIALHYNTVDVVTTEKTRTAEAAVRATCYLLACSFGAKNYGRPSIWWPRVLEDARKVVERLRIVWIESLPWQQCLAKFAGPDTFFYLDPPYHCGGSKAYAYQFTDDDHRQLAAVLCGPAGASGRDGVGRSKWLLSYNDDPFIRGLYAGRPGIIIESVSVPYSIARRGRMAKGELLIRNYDLPPGAKE